MPGLGCAMLSRPPPACVTHHGRDGPRKHATRRGAGVGMVQRRVARRLAMTQTYYTQADEPVRLGQEIGKGGEGSVYAVEGRALECAKIYNKPPSADTANKLLVMVDFPPDDPTWVSRQHHSIAWPLAVLYPDAGKSAPAGFLM